jgi:hypothetical protein
LYGKSTVEPKETIMGLAERRAVQDIKDNHYPAWEKSIHEAAGFAVPVEMDWDSLAIPNETHLYLEAWPMVFIEPTVAALKDVARDDLGQHALKEGLKKITIKHNHDIYSGDVGRFVSFDEGVLALQHAAHTNINDVSDRTAGIVKALESGL